MQSFVELRNVSKNYGAVKALDNLSFSIRLGEVHALLGENGAGKSTAMRIVRGETEPTSGQVVIDGKIVTRFSPRVFDGYGIAMVHQELTVFDGLSVAENILPASPARDVLGFVKWAELRARAGQLLAVFDLSIDPSQPMSSLTVGQKQTVEIARAVSDERRLIILDEPTSSLNANETEILLELIKSLRRQGKSVLFVSHRIPEVLEISDRVTVLRDGRFVDTLENRELSEDYLVTRMVGRDLTNLHTKRKASATANDIPVLSVESLCGELGLTDASLTLHKGEMLGVFGLEGSGTAELSRLLFGLDQPISGRIDVGG
ncbi:MAG: sugar ABC transporter ATP-binding protein, partial [Hyphomicrobiales bacterium]|nr:sugar ABC transporter ATP-binding protein [Hyphomicrobiales bacterium]